MHRLAGISSGEKIAITKDSLPGAVLFPAFVVSADSSSQRSTPATPVQGDGESKAPIPPTGKALDKQDHRYLVVTRERFIVLNSGGEGVGAQATVCSNNHLTELIKMTFRKKDPDLVSLFFVTSIDDEEMKAPVSATQGSNEDLPTPTTTLKPQPFRIAKRKEFIEV